MHAKGYPSHGDAKDTIPVPSMDERAKPEGKGEGTTKFVDFKFEGDKSEWCGYARERLGRFVGLINKDGTTKTECGIHVEGARRPCCRPHRRRRNARRRSPAVCPPCPPCPVSSRRRGEDLRP